MTFTQFIAVLLARRKAAVLLLVSMVAVVAGLSALQPRQYRASAAVIIDTRLADPVAAAGTGGSTNNSSFMATQSDLIQSELVALQAARSMGLDKNEQWRSRWAASNDAHGSHEAWMADQLLKSLEVRPSRDSNVVSIGFVATDARFAANAANAFARAYIDTTLDMKVEAAKRQNSFFDERATQLRAGLEAAQSRLSAYQQAKGIVATDERLDVENIRLSELSSQVVLLQGLSAESASRQGQAGANSQEVLANVTISNITAELARQEAKLSELRQRLSDKHPQLIELTASVTQLRTRLDTETRRVASSAGVNSSVNRSRLGAAQAALNEQRERLLRLRGQRDEAAVLLRDVDSAQRAYDANLARVAQTRLESQNTFTNVSIIKTASAPARPSSPRILLNSAVALVVGGLLVLGFVLLRESHDRRLRFDTDVTELLGQPLLASIPGSIAGKKGLPDRQAVRKGLFDRLMQVGT